MKEPFSVGFFFKFSVLIGAEVHYRLNLSSGRKFGFISIFPRAILFYDNKTLNASLLTTWIQICDLEGESWLASLVFS